MPHRESRQHHRTGTLCRASANEFSEFPFRLRPVQFRHSSTESPVLRLFTGSPSDSRRFRHTWPCSWPKWTCPGASQGIFKFSRCQHPPWVGALPAMPSFPPPIDNVVRASSYESALVLLQRLPWRDQRPNASRQTAHNSLCRSGRTSRLIPAFRDTWGANFFIFSDCND